MPRHDARRLRAWLTGAALVVVAATAADAREAAHIRPGERVYGELAGGASATVLVDGVAGMSFSATCRAFRGTKLAVTLSLAAPDGTPADVSKLLKIAKGGGTARLSGFVFPATGAFRVTVTSSSGAAGEFDLDTTGTLPNKVAGTGTTTAGDTPLTFAAAPGDLVTCSVRPAHGAKSAPTLRRFVDADGDVTDVNAPRTAKPIAVVSGGASRFDVDSAAPGAFSYVLRFVRAKPPRAPLDMADVAAAGTLSGTAFVEGLDATAASSSAVQEKKTARRAPPPDVAAGELVVSLPGATTSDDVVAAAEASLPGASCRVAAALTARGPYLVRVGHLVDKTDRRSRLATRVLAKSAAADGRLAWCEPNAYAQATVEPSDPLWEQQYDLKEIRCPEAWDITRGARSIVVAVIDTGMSNHPDLAGAWLPGYDFISSASSAADGDGWDADPTDAASVYHGTHVAGTIAARANDGIGISGIAPECMLLPVRVLGRQGLGTTFDIAAGLMWSVGLPVSGAPPNPYPARVVNMSLGTPADAQILRDAVAQVIARTTTVVVASAGNNANSAPSYPAAYPGVVAVTAVDSNLRLTSYSSYGSWVSIAAPGGDQSRGLHGILSTWIDTSSQLSTYRELDGTSMAAPHVAGVAALLLSADPTLDRAGVTQAMFTTALDLGAPGFDWQYGWGVVDARAALDSIAGPGAQPTVFAAPQALTFSASDGRLSIFVGVTHKGSVSVNGVSVVTDQDPAGWLTASTQAAVLPAVVAVDVDPNLAVGAYSGRVVIDTSGGRLTVPVSVFRAPPPQVSAVVIEAFDALGKLAGRTTTGPALNWAWSMPGVPLGSYQLTSYADFDGTLAADRVDEFFGAWPIATQPSVVDVTPDDLDHDGLVVRLARYDERFEGIGVGGGPPVGAVAVRAIDERTGADVTGATLHLLDGPTLAATDVRGRALVVGGYNAPQTVTLVADGYAPTSRVGVDAQFLGFKMSPLTPVATRGLATTLYGFGPADVLAYVQVGDAETRLAPDAFGAASATLTVVDSAGPLPVSVVAYDKDGAATRRAFLFATPDGSGLVIHVAPSVAAAASSIDAALPSGFPDAAAADLRAEAFIHGDDGRWMTLGGAPLVNSAPTSFAWAQPDADPVRETKIEVSAHDAAGRVFREIARGTTLVPPSFHGLLQMRAPTTLVAPADAAVGVDEAPTFTWTTSPGARVHRVVIETLDGSWRRILLADGSVTSVRLPSPAGAGLAAATTYRWSVESSFGLNIDSRSHDDDDLETKTDGFSSSETATFTTK